MPQKLDSSAMDSLFREKSGETPTWLGPNLSGAVYQGLLLQMKLTNSTPKVEEEFDNFQLEMVEANDTKCLFNLTLKKDLNLLRFQIAIVSRGFSYRVTLL